MIVALLALDEIKDVRMVHAEDAHIRSSSRSSLFDRLCRCIENAHERHRAARNSMC